jgi:hypothetical protein
VTEAESTRWTTARILFVMVKDGDADGPSHLTDILSYLSRHLNSDFGFLRTKKTCYVQADDVPYRCNRVSRIYASLKLKLLCISSQHSDLARRHSRRRFRTFFSLLHISLLRRGMPAPESVVLETNLGNIQLELYWDHAPRVCLLSLILNL